MAFSRIKITVFLGILALTISSLKKHFGAMERPSTPRLAGEPRAAAEFRTPERIPATSDPFEPPFPDWPSDHPLMLIEMRGGLPCLRLVSFNILSSKLFQAHVEEELVSAGIDRIKAKALAAKVESKRIDKIFQILHTECRSAHIVCLQEVPIHLLPTICQIFQKDDGSFPPYRFIITSEDPTIAHGALTIFNGNFNLLRERSASLGDTRRYLITRAMFRETADPSATCEVVVTNVHFKIGEEIGDPFFEAVKHQAAGALGVFICGDFNLRFSKTRERGIPSASSSASGAGAELLIPDDEGRIKLQDLRDKLHTFTGDTYFYCPEEEGSDLDHCLVSSSFFGRDSEPTRISKGNTRYLKTDYLPDWIRGIIAVEMREKALFTPGKKKSHRLWDLLTIAKTELKDVFSLPLERKLRYLLLQRASSVFIVSTRGATLVDTDPHGRALYVALNALEKALPSEIIDLDDAQKDILDQLVERFRALCTSIPECSFVSGDLDPSAAQDMLFIGASTALEKSPSALALAFTKYAVDRWCEQIIADDSIPAENKGAEKLLVLNSAQRIIIQIRSILQADAGQITAKLGLAEASANYITTLKTDIERSVDFEAEPPF